MMDNEEGQSIVEYIMLLGVVLTLVLVVIQNEKFREIMGPNSTIVNGMRNSMMYTYRHGRPGTAELDNSTYTGNHDTFTNTDGSGSRFFSNDEDYPKP